MLEYLDMRRAAIVVIIIAGLAVGPAYSYWIWTPKTGKWFNPKYEAKATPKEQLEYALAFYNIKKYDDVKRELAKLIKAFPKAAEAAEAQYYLGRVADDQGNAYDAFEAYQKVIDKYPFSERIQEINSREYDLAEEFMNGKKRTALGVALPVENPALEIFQKVIDNSTYGPLAAKAEYKLGVVLKSLVRYYEAEDAFNKVLKNYPDSEWAEAAKFQLAACRAAISRGSDYDQGAAQEAKDKFQEFVKEHPDAVLSRDAEKNIQQLNDREAESFFGTGLFYEKQKKYDAAKVYYNDCINTYPDSVWAAKSLERLQLLEKKNK